MTSVFTTFNNNDALVIEDKFIYTGEFNNKKEPEGIGRLTLKDGGLYFKGYFDMEILLDKIKELRKLKPICRYCFDKGNVECDNCGGEYLYDNKEKRALHCPYCNSTGFIPCTHCV